MFFSHTTGGLGIGYVTERWAVALAVLAITDFPLPTHPKISVLQIECNVQLCNFVRVPPFEGYVRFTFL